MREAGTHAPRAGEAAVRLREGDEERSVVEGCDGSEDGSGSSAGGGGGGGAGAGCAGMLASCRCGGGGAARVGVASLDRRGGAGDERLLPRGEANRTG